MNRAVLKRAWRRTCDCRPLLSLPDTVRVAYLWAAGPEVHADGQRGAMRWSARRGLVQSFRALADSIGPERPSLTVGKSSNKTGGANVFPDERGFHSRHPRHQRAEWSPAGCANTARLWRGQKDTGLRKHNLWWRPVSPKPDNALFRVHTRLTKHADQLQLTSRSMVSGGPGHVLCDGEILCPTRSDFSSRRNGVSHSPDDGRIMTGWAVGW